jgi:hypothetical protein
MAEEAMKYHIVVTRDGDGWLADVPALPGTHTWAKTWTRSTQHSLGRRPGERHPAEVLTAMRDPGSI